MAKRLKFDKDNILGWTEEEFNDLICEMVNLQITNNIRVHPANQRVYFDHGRVWLNKRWGIDKEQMRKELLQEQIDKLQKELNQCK